MPSRFYTTELAIRRALPERAKQLWRLGRLALQPPGRPAPTIPQRQLEGCVLLADRLEMLRRLPSGGQVAELGTERGDFARAILDLCQPAALHLVDVSFALTRADVLDDPRVTQHAMTTQRFLAGRSPDEFDVIYVDADHGYQAVTQDIALAADKVRPGGLLAFNDFARIVRPGFGVFGVHQAVCEFAVERGWPVAFFCLEGEALYDIALRRPT